MKTWAVYLYRDAARTPIYVGRTNQLESRHEQHARRSPWWSEVASREVDSQHKDLAAAEAREQQLIDELRPRHNRAHNRSWTRPPSLARRFRIDAAGLSRHRLELGETQRVFAERCGIGRSALAHAETGERDLSVSALMLVSQRLNVHPSALLIEEQPQVDQDCAPLEASA